MGVLRSHANLHHNWSTPLWRCLAIGWKPCARASPSRQDHRTCFFWFSWFFDGFWMVFWGLIIPKWLIKAPGHIPLLFGSFLELPKCSPNLAPYTPYLSQKHFSKYKKNPQTSSKHFFTYLNTSKIHDFKKWKLSNIQHLKTMFFVCFKFWWSKNNFSQGTHNKNGSLWWYSFDFFGNMNILKHKKCPKAEHLKT